MRDVQSKKKKLISLLLASDQSKERKATESEAQVSERERLEVNVWAGLLMRIHRSFENFLADHRYDHTDYLGLAV